MAAATPTSARNVAVPGRPPARCLDSSLVSPPRAGPLNGPRKGCRPRSHDPQPRRLDRFPTLAYPGRALGPRVRVRVSGGRNPPRSAYKAPLADRHSIRIFDRQPNCSSMVGLSREGPDLLRGPLPLHGKRNISTLPELMTITSRIRCSGMTEPTAAFTADTNSLVHRPEVPAHTRQPQQ